MVFQIGDKFRIGYEVTDIFGGGDHGTPVYITDDAQNWQAEEIIGRRIQFSGKSFNLGKAYTVLDAYPDFGMLVLDSNSDEDAVLDGVSIGDKFVVANSVESIDPMANTITIDTNPAENLQGIPIQFTSGAQHGHCYVVQENVGNTITLAGGSIDLSTVAVGDTFNIGKLFMYKLDPADNNYIDGVKYTCSVPFLGNNPGLSDNCHTAFFKSYTKQITSADQFTGNTVLTDAWVKTETLSGPLMAPTAFIRDGVVAPNSGTGNTTFAFSAYYSNINGEPPAYMNLIIDDDTTNAISMYQDYTSSNFMQGVRYTITVNDLLPGMHRYRFEAADSRNTTRLPDKATGNFNDLTVLYDPVLTSPAVEPATGDASTVFTYSVTYTDADNLPPASIDLMIDGMVVDSSNYTVSHDANTYINGTRYTFTLKKGFIDDVGTHSYSFRAVGPMASESEAVYIMGNGPDIGEYALPVLQNGSVTPTTGLSTTPYNFSVTYRSTLGPFGQAPSYVVVNFDGADIPMSASSGNTNFTQGVIYRASVNAASGEHSYYFKASDGTAYAVFDLYGSVSSLDSIVAAGIPGPFVNDAPTLFNPGILPNPESGVSPDQQITYKVY
jgi:hypothetical protein